MGHGATGLARLVLENSLLLVAGTVAAAVWANLDFSSYDAVARPVSGRDRRVDRLYRIAFLCDGGVS
jgi:hypothetical protein